MCEPLIREFYSNAVIREDELSCWVRGIEFTLDAHDIDDVLGLEGLEDHDFINYKERMLSIETVQQRIGGQREGRCLNTTTFLADMRCLIIIMMFNLYPIKKLTKLLGFVFIICRLYGLYHTLCSLYVLLNQYF